MGDLRVKKLSKGMGWCITVDSSTFEIEMRKVDLSQSEPIAATMSVRDFIQLGQPGTEELKKIIMKLVDA